MGDIVFNMMKNFHNLDVEQRELTIKQVQDIYKTDEKFYKSKKNMTRNLFILGVVAIIVECLVMNGKTFALSGLNVFSISLLVVVTYNTMYDLFVKVPADKRDLDLMKMNLEVMENIHEEFNKIDEKREEQREEQM